MRFSLFGNEAGGLERRAFNALVLASFIISILIIIEALMFGYVRSLVLASSASVLFLTIYISSLYYENSHGAILIYVVVSGFVAFADWFFVGGRAGLALFIIMAIAIAIPIITKKEQLRVVTVVLILIYGGLFCSTLVFSDTMPAANNDLQQLIIHLFEVGVLVLCLYFVAFFAISSYRGEKETISILYVELSVKNKFLEESKEQLESALREIKTLRGLLSTCSYCKKIRPDDIGPNDSQSWMPIERFVEQHSEATFTHGICPDCLKEHFGEDLYRKVFKADS